MKSVKVENDLWKNSQYLEVPPSGTTYAGGTFWLPSPIPVVANSSWTITPYELATSSPTMANVAVILHISYYPTYPNAPQNGIISREKDVEISGNSTDWQTVGTITDLDPSKKYIITGGVGVGDDNLYGLRLKSDSFKGLTPIFPGTTMDNPAGITQLQLIPEGMPIFGTQNLTIECFKITGASDKHVYAYIYFAEE